jgi:thiol-disulfide isomerase/thioredoxin
VADFPESGMIRYAAALMAGALLLGPVQAGKFNTKVSIGDAAPVWSSLSGTDGKSHSLSDLKDKDVVVVIITCNHCPVAKAYEDRFIAMSKKYAGKKVAFVAICVSHEEEDTLAKMKERAREKSFPYLYLQDKSQKIGLDLGATVTPEVFVLNKDRKIVYMGRVDDSWNKPANVKKKYLEDALEAHLKGQKIPLAETAGYGCSVTYEEKK